MITYSGMEAVLRPTTWAGNKPDSGDRPVGMHEDAFDQVFGMPGIGGQENQHRGTKGSSVPLGLHRAVEQQSGTYTSSNERMYYKLEQQADTRLMMLHPDTLMPIMRPSAGIDGVVRARTALLDTDAGWAVGFVVADGGVIRKIVPQAPADHAELVQESAEGVWQGRCCIGDRVRTPFKSAFSLLLPQPP